MPPSLRRPFWLAFWVTGFTVAMTALLLAFKYESVTRTLAQDRVDLVAREIVAIAEKDLALGQNFRDIATLQEAIVRRAAAEPLFEGIDVSGADGRIAYATDRRRVGTQLPEEWRAALARGEQRLEPARDSALVAAPIRNSFGQLTGHAVVRYGRGPEREALAQFVRRLVPAMLAVFAAATLILFALLVRLGKTTERDLDRAAAALEGAPGDHPLSAELAPVQARFAAAARLLEAAKAAR